MSRLITSNFMARISALGVLTLMLAGIVCGFGLWWHPPTRVGVAPAVVPHLHVACETWAQANGDWDVTTRSEDDRLSLTLQALDPATGEPTSEPSAIHLSLFPESPGDTQAFSVRLASPSPAQSGLIAALKQALQSPDAPPLWVWEDGTALPRRHAVWAGRLFGITAVCWLLVLAAGFLLPFRLDFSHRDAALGLALCASLAWMSASAAVPLDIKLHFLPLDLGRTDIISFYGIGFPGFLTWVDWVAGRHPCCVYAAVALTGMGSLILLYTLTARLTNRRIAAWTVLLLSVHPLWLRALLSDSSHLPALFATLTACALWWLGPPRFHIRLLAVVALVLAMSVRLELLVLPLVLGLLIWVLRKRPFKHRPPVWTPATWLALGCGALWLIPNYLLLASSFPTESGLELDPWRTLVAAIGFNDGNLWFDRGFSPAWIPWLTWLGFLRLLQKKQYRAVLAAVAALALFLVHPFTTQRLFQSIHYQVPLWPIAALVAGYALAELQSVLAAGRSRRVQAAMTIAAAGLLVATPASFGTLLSDTPTAAHGEAAFLTRQAANLDPTRPVWSWKTDGDGPLKNPDLLLEALGAIPSDWRFGTHERPLPAPEDRAVYYYRSAACWIDPSVAGQCRTFEQRVDLTPLATQTIPARAFAHERYPSAEFEIGLYRIEAPTTADRQPAEYGTKKGGNNPP